LSRVIGNFGFKQFMIGRLRVTAENVVEPLAFLFGWPAEWRRHYVKEAYHLNDPVIRWGSGTVDPFDWSEAEIDRTAQPRSLEVMRVARDFGLRHGFAVPIVRQEYIDMVTIAGEQPDLS